LSLPKPGDEPEEGDQLDRLTQRERQVLQLIGQAYSNKEIATVLNLSVNTVNVHRTNLMATLNLHSTAELVLFAVKKGLVPLPK
jgi:DNA-binding NarL/FixJ family response regulator